MVITIASPPETIGTQSKRVSGGAIGTDSMYSASVIGLRYTAAGFFLAHARCASGMQPKSSRSSPWRRP